MQKVGGVFLWLLYCWFEKGSVDSDVLVLMCYGREGSHNVRGPRTTIYPRERPAKSSAANNFSYSLGFYTTRLTSERRINLLLRLITGIYDQGYWMKPLQKALRHAQTCADLKSDGGWSVYRAQKPP